MQWIGTTRNYTLCKPLDSNEILREGVNKQVKWVSCLLKIQRMAFARVREAQAADRHEVAKMRALLWPEASVQEHLLELEHLLGHGMNGTLPVVIFVSCEEEGTLTGFLEAGLRSHADGCNPIHPVGFVEGWFVHESFRNRGIGKLLMRFAEDWARARGCIEMASDTWINDEGSVHAHESLGFEIVDRCIHFRKTL
jgi:aminoglycoside 6'-N-acetyltransferase I